MGFVKSGINGYVTVIFKFEMYSEVSSVAVKLLTFNLIPHWGMLWF